MEHQSLKSMQPVQSMQLMPSIELCKPIKQSRYSAHINYEEQGTHYDAHALSRLHEVFLIVMIACSILTLIVLCQLKPTENHGWAYFLNYCFGGMDYLMPMYMVYVASALYLHWRKPLQSAHALMLKLIGATLLYLSIDTVWQSGEVGRSISQCFFGMHYSPEAFVVLISAIISSVFLMTHFSCAEIVTLIRNAITTFFSRKNFQYYPIEKTYQENHSPYRQDANLISYEKPFDQPFIHDPQSNQLIDCLKQFGIHAIVSQKIEGPVITRFEVHLAPGTKSSAICARQKEIARSLCVEKVSVIEAIFGKRCIGIDIQNTRRETFSFDELKHVLENHIDKKLPLLLGKNIDGSIKVADLYSMPHLLIAGSTQSGKTMLLQSILMSLTHSLSSQELKIILCDPKMLSFTAWKKIPHLLRPVITNGDDAIHALNFCIEEMERRYQIMSQSNQHHFPQIVLIIDEVADLMMTHKSEVESAVMRLAQKARQSGIHLILSTQRPTVDIITGHIKTNIPSRIALSVPDKISSRNILDENGAYELFGQGDMLLKINGKPCERVHAPFVSDDEIKEHVSNLISNNLKLTDENNIVNSEPALLNYSNITHIDFKKNNNQLSRDLLYEDAVAFVRETKKASTTRLQNKFNIGYQKAAAIMERMEKEGIVSKQVKCNEPREVFE